MSTTISKHARFDARLPIEVKELFERAAHLGGFRSLTDFIVSTVQEKAREIVKEKEQIIASEKDAEVFFDTITNPRQPSENLTGALKDYDAFMSKQKND